MAPELKAADGRVEGAHSFIGIKFNLRSAAAQSFLKSTPLLECAEGKLKAINWNAEIPPQFRRQLASGIEWINLAASGEGESPVHAENTGNQFEQ